MVDEEGGVVVVSVGGVRAERTERGKEIERDSESEEKGKTAREDINY